MNNNFDRFTGLADVYEKARPGYAANAIDYILSRLAPPNPSFADIGAGTGKLSELLAPRVSRLYAVEPNSDMRSKLIAVLAPFPNAEVINGGAEVTGLPDNSVDAVICAQAFHWFYANAFRRECERVLRPGGQIIIVYNQHDYHHRESVYNSSDRERLASAFFNGEMLRASFPNSTSYDRDGYVAYRLSHSNSPNPGDADYESAVAGYNGFFDSENTDGIITLDFITNVYSKV
ncbi:MAG: class I SAM-dependent methyltransferase [Oscillospiraceae bacterium]|jgi:SAM-dependent methyltransferase|nr:class I SAM-dependent methyltransferase [Oscillospiraceae bacterium]